MGTRDYSPDRAFRALRVIVRLNRNGVLWMVPRDAGGKLI